MTDITDKKMMDRVRVVGSGNEHQPKLMMRCLKCEVINIDQELAPEL